MLHIGGSFEQAAVRSRLLMDFEVFSKEELDRIIGVTISSRFVYDSFSSQGTLRCFFKKYEADIEKEKYNEVMKSLKKVK